LSEGKSHKFWEIELSGASFTTSYGRIGTAGQSTTKSFDSADKAQRECDKLIAEKVKKGYTQVGLSDAASLSPEKRVVSSATSTSVPSTTANAAGVPTSAKTSTKTTAKKANLAPSTKALEEVESSVNESGEQVCDDAAQESSAPSATAHMATSADEEPILEWTAELEKAATRVQKELEVKRRAELEAGANFMSLHRCYMRGARKRIMDGRSFSKEYADLVLDIDRIYTNTTPPAKLDPRVEAAAHQLLAKAGEKDLLESVRPIDYWVAKAGLPFALEAFATTLGSTQVAVEYSKSWGDFGSVWLEAVSDRTPEALLGSRDDKLLRSRLLMASPEEKQEAREKAIELRSAGNLVVRSALSSVFVDREWIEEDLKERERTKEPAVFVEVALLEVCDLELLRRYFATLKPNEADFLRPSTDRYSASPSADLALLLLARHRERALAVLAAWLCRMCEHEDWPLRATAAIPHLLSLLRHGSGSKSLAQAAVAVLTHDAQKGENPDPMAVVLCMRQSPAWTLPLLQHAAKQKHGAWAKTMLSQVERLLGGGSAAAEATSAELPQVLQKGSSFKAPEFWMAEAFRRPLLVNNKALPITVMSSFGAVLQKADAKALRDIKEACDADSLAEFAWDLFQAWLLAGAPTKQKWAFLMLGFFGNDACARMLTPLIRSWPGEAAHARAVTGLDVLGEIGSDVAMMMLHGIAQRVKFKGLQERARQKMDQIAEARGLTADELADRLVPDLGLEDDGSLTLDFGPRTFRVGFDENLTPFVIDASGSRIKDLPKPNSKDEAELADTAVITWKKMKRDARTLSTAQLLRFELAMGSQRRWAAPDFNAFIVRHPLLVHLARRLVWGAFDAEGQLNATFRVAEDRSLATPLDEAFELPQSARVGIVHRLELSDDDVAAWSRLFADYELLQPFDQLARATFTATALEKQAHLFSRFDDRTVETKKILGLLHRGWQRGAVQDAGFAHDFVKPVSREINAILQISPGISVGSPEYTDATQTLGAIEFAKRDTYTRAPVGSVSEIMLSELIRDVELLGNS